LTAITKTTAGLNLFRDSWGALQSPTITYIAWGSSNTTPTAADTQLGNETGRKRITSYTQGANGELLVSCYLSPTDAVGQDIEEIGVIGGSSATSAANTGVLIAHGLYSHNPKVSTESIQVTLDATVS
jgi:hypothetical protein